MNLLESYKKLNITNTASKVIVQEMIQSDYSGVIFTANPTGILNEMVIVAGEGLGCNIVEDKISTTTYYYNVDDKNYYFENENILNKNILKCYPCTYTIFIKNKCVTKI